MLGCRSTSAGTYTGSTEGAVGTIGQFPEHHYRIHVSSLFRGWTFNFDACRSQYDTIMRVYDHPGNGTPNLIGYSNDDCGRGRGYQSEVSLYGSFDVNLDILRSLMFLIWTFSGGGFFSSAARAG